VTAGESRFNRWVVRLATYALFGAAGLVALPVILFVALNIAMQIPAPKTEVTNRKPFADHIGREYRVVGDVSALAWNDFPDKDTILSISLMSPPLVQNRFVSYRKRLDSGQTVRIVNAWRQVTLGGFTYEYGVDLDESGFPEAIPVTMGVSSDGVPDPHVYEPIER
jgi:hypothetical protein